MPKLHPKTKVTGHANLHENSLPGKNYNLSYNRLRVGHMTLAGPIKIIPSTLLGLLENFSLGLQSQWDISLELYVFIFVTSSEETA